MNKKPNKFSPEVRERAVRMVQEHRGEYPSLWAAIESIAPKIGCVPLKLDLYEVFCAVLYLLRTGCQWKFLPSEFPKWTTVYAYWRKWSEPDQHGVSVLEQALKNQVGAARVKLGRNACSTFLIVDAQSVKNTDTAALKGYDVGKKVAGIKRHIAVDTQGLPHAVAVTTAEVTDRKGALQALKRCKPVVQVSNALSALIDSASVQADKPGRDKM